MIDIEAAKRHVEEFLYLTESARDLSERDRDYKDNKQWTAEQVQALASRKQAPIIDNRIKPKSEALKGLLIQRRGSPKAYPRTKAHEESSEPITDSLRYVRDATNLDQIELEVFDNQHVEGYGGAIIDIEVRKNGIEVKPTHIPWDRIYFDPHSRRIDFKDATYMGIVMWADAEIVRTMFKGKEAVIESALIERGFDETFEDRPRWREIDGKRKRIRLAHEFCLHDGKWYECVFTGNHFLIEPRDSSYLDEDGQPCNPIELVGAYIDRDNNRFGEVRYWIDPQNEINHRRSKFLHQMSSRQTFSRKGEVDDVQKLKRELAKPDGHVEFIGQKFGEDFGIIPTNDMAQAQFELLQESKATLDAVSFDAKLAGMGKQDLSGVAVQSLQSAAMLEVASLFSAMADWKERVYKQCWYRIKQHWTEEKWVRVTDDYGKLRWVGLNVGVPRQQVMEDFINNAGNPVEARRQAATMLQQMIQAQDPRLQEIVKTKNMIPELDMDIVIEQVANTVNMQQEQFRILADLAAARPNEVPFKSLLKLSDLRDKDDIIKDIEEREKAATQAQAQTQQLETADLVATIEGKQIANQRNAAAIEQDHAKTTNINMDSISKQVKNQVMLANPDPTPQAVV